MMRAWMLAVTLSLSIGPCWANDSTAELRTGGLVLTKTPDIEMRSEDLFISADSVVVKYRFFNHSVRDIATAVAFPMPDITASADGEDIAIPESSKDNFLDFQTTVNGAPVPASLEQHALAGGADYTHDLQALGIPLFPQAAATNKALDSIPQANWNDFVGRGLAVVNSDGGDGDKHLEARWTLKSVYSWTQVFPAGQELVVEHRYRPSVGSSVGTSLGIAGNNNADYIRRYCIESDILATVNRTMSRSQNGPPLAEQRISYILKSGANWAGPIVDFHLVVDKGNPKNLVSFCGNDVRKISPTRFEMVKRNFLPEADIDILILIPSDK